MYSKHNTHSNDSTKKIIFKENLKNRQKIKLESFIVSLMGQKLIKYLWNKRIV